MPDVDTVVLQPQAAAAPVLSTQALTDGLLRDLSGKWPGSQITFSIPSGSASWPGYDPAEEPTAPYRWYGFNGTQAARAAAALAQWDRLIAPGIVQVSDPGDIRFAFTDMPNGNAWGWAYYPTGGSSAVAGDIWVSVSGAGDSELGADWADGEFGWEALQHEIGHALGLKHPFDNPALPEAYANRRYTIMAYDDPPQGEAVVFTVDGSGISYVARQVYASTPMVLDVLAIQALYGADTTTATGNDRYSFDQTTAFMETLYDAGGTDTIDLSNLTRASNVSLEPGSYSSIAVYSTEAQIADTVARAPGHDSFIRNVIDSRDTYTFTDNLGIAFSTVIENVVGGSGADSVFGNSAANRIEGGAGGDYLLGLDGSDLVDGGAGNDEMVNGNQGSDTVYGGAGDDWVLGGKDNDVVYGGDDGDRMVNGNIGNDTVYGGIGGDAVHGGQNDDVLYGQSGNDTLNGDLGSDSLWGGSGADRFAMAANGGNDVVMDFSFGDGDRLQLAAGTTFTVAAGSGGQAIVTLSSGGTLDLAGIVTGAVTKDWVVYA